MRKLVNSYSLFLLLFLCTRITYSQTDTSFNPNAFSKKRTWLVSSVHVAGYVGSITALSSIWYNNFNRTKLHSFNDLDEWGGMDKAGHITTAWQLAKFSAYTFRWCGIPYKKSALLGSGFSLLYLTTLEFFDGYSADWGFSFSDMGANILGCGLAYFHNTEELANLQFKWSFWPSKYPAYREDVLGKTIPEQMLKDYNGQTYWLNINMPLKWFKQGQWLCFSLGYSIDGYTGGKQNYFDPSIQNPPILKRNREFLFSLDVDFSRLKIKNKILKNVTKIFRVVKVPFPAFGISTSGKLIFKPAGF